MKKFLILALVCFSTITFAKKTEFVSFTEDKLAVLVTPDQPQFILKLKSNPTTGYSWFLKSYDANIFIPKKHFFNAEKNSHLVGAPGIEEWVFATKKDAFIVPQTSMMTFVYKRPWENSTDNREVSFVFSLTAKK